MKKTSILLVVLVCAGFAVSAGAEPMTIYGSEDKPVVYNPYDQTILDANTGETLADCTKDRKKCADLLEGKVDKPKGPEGGGPEGGGGNGGGGGKKGGKNK